jgi:hypothetical protein
MAGSPLKRAEQAAISEHEERIFEMLDEGKTQFEISLALGYRQSSISRWLNATPERKAKLAASRALASDGLVEHSLDLADKVQGLDNAEVQAAKLKIDTRMRIAAFWNPQRYGERQQAGVVVNIGSLHLDALRNAQAPLMPADVVSPQLDDASGVAALQSSGEGIRDVDVIEVVSTSRAGDEFGLM